MDYFVNSLTVFKKNVEANSRLKSDQKKRKKNNPTFFRVESERLAKK